MRIGRELLRRQLAVLATDEVVECASSSTSIGIAATPGTRGTGPRACAQPRPPDCRPIARRPIAELSSVLADAGVGVGVGVLFHPREPLWSILISACV